jgi:hypothetical protein
MKENEIELKIQALVDGELTEFEAGKLRDRIKNDIRLQILHERLTQMKDLISTHEMPRVLPESSDFYWSKIAQEIEVGESAAQSLGMKWVFRRLAPLLGIASVALLITLQGPNLPDLGIVLDYNHELELLVDEIDVMTFNSADDSMSVVWIDYSMDIQKDYMELWLD